MGEFNSSRASPAQPGANHHRGDGYRPDRATVLALTDYALAELDAPYRPSPRRWRRSLSPVQEKAPKPARKKAAARTAEDDAAMLTQIWDLYLGSRFRWRGVRWVTRTTEEWRIVLKLAPQFAVTKKVSEMEEAGWIFSIGGQGATSPFGPRPS